MNIESLVSREKPTDPEVLEEFSRHIFHLEEHEAFFGCRHILIQQGVEPMRAERDAMAALLENRRRKSPSLTTQELQQAMRYYDVLKGEMNDEAAEKKAVANVLAMRPRRKLHG